MFQLVFTALKAFHLFNSLAADPHRSLTLSLATSGMELTDTIELRTDSSLQTLPLPSLPTKVFVYATGAGCATVQVCHVFCQLIHLITYIIILLETPLFFNILFIAQPFSK